MRVLCVFFVCGGCGVWVGMVMMLSLRNDGAQCPCAVIASECVRVEAGMKVFMPLQRPEMHNSGIHGHITLSSIYGYIHSLERGQKCLKLSVKIAI